MKSACCGFNWWNSCLCFDVMFGYVNLMIIKLLMMKLHAQVISMCILCVLLKIGGVWYCSWWIVDEFTFNWCCCYHEMLLMIETLGNHNHRVIVLICVVFWKFYKNRSNGDLWWNDVLIQVLYGFWVFFLCL